jgi:UDP-glucuronate decarboxylase
VDNIEAFLGDPAFTLLKHDVTEAVAVGVDQIYNLPVRPRLFTIRPIRSAHLK